jgi:curved DNA-binding protein CbpA
MNAPYTEPTLYEDLEVSPRASAPVIKAAYRCLAQLNHPDKNPDQDSAAERLTRINHAYAVLSDPAQRQFYDLTLGAPRRMNERRGQTAAERRPWEPSPPKQTGTRPFAFRPLN